MSAIAAGLVVMLAWLVIACLIIGLVNFLLHLSSDLGRWIFKSHGFLPGRIVALLIWIPLALFRLCILFIGFLSAVLLARKARRWL